LSIKMTPAFALALMACMSSAVLASDWVEDPHAVRMPPVAPSRVASVQRPQPQSSQPTNFLTGSATRFGKTLPEEPQALPPGRPMSPQMAPQNNFSLDANQFIAGTRKDTIVPPDMMRGWLDKTHPEFRLNAQANAGAVLEIKGAWDKAGQIMDAMGVPHRAIKAKELREVSLDGVKVLVINCEGKIPEDCVEKIRQWVVHGGYVISTDWTLHTFLERAFPGMVAYNGGNTPGTVVDAVVVDRDPVLFNGVPVNRAAWKLDEESQMVKVLRPDVVKVLAHSWRLSSDDRNRNTTRDPNQWGVLACEFPYGRGKVLHLVGHYDYNSPLGFTRNVLQDAIPGVGVGLRQAISTNFLIEGLSSRTSRSSSGYSPAF
jgi:hypothetical protein